MKIAALCIYCTVHVLYLCMQILKAVFLAIVFPIAEAQDTTIQGTV